MEIVLIDNYDSFTYNLAFLVRQLGAKVKVVRNDMFDLDDLEMYDRILLSPGPGIPEEAGLLLPTIRHYAGRKPILGICLGHQAIGEVFGAQLINLDEVFHGVATEGTQTGADCLFDGLPERISMGRYHSWAIDPRTLPDCLEVTATSDDGCIMAIRHKTLNVRGIQFHPESVLTGNGAKMMENWLRYCI